MAKLEIAGRAFELAPLRLGALRKAAAYLDRINSRSAEMADDIENAKLDDAMETAHEMCEVLAIALIKIDPDCNCDWLEDQIGMENIGEIQQVFKALLIESGLAKKGEAQAPSPGQAEGASQTAEELPISSDA